ncbi:MAG: orotate phosphoribosyltransferase [Candidatus Babeliales bacterium]
MKRFFSLVVAGTCMALQLQAQEKVCTKQELMMDVYDIGSVKFGDFMLKVTDGFMSTPIYLDLRRIMSHPELMKKVVTMMHEAVRTVSYDVVCGVPSAAIPYAAVFSAQTNKPLIMSRQTMKHHGMCQSVEGDYHKGQRVLLFEDVMVSGASIGSAVETLRKEGLIVEDVVVLCDRQQGGMRHVAQECGVRVHVIFTLEELLELLEQEEKIDHHTAELVRTYIAHNQCS